jgi:hypothetical protein
MAPSLINKNHNSKNYEDQKKYDKIKKPFRNIKSLLKTILNMLETTLPMRRELFITIIIKNKKGFMAQHQSKNLKNLKKRELMLK